MCALVRIVHLLTRGLSLGGCTSRASALAPFIRIGRLSLLVAVCFSTLVSCQAPNGAGGDGTTGAQPASWSEQLELAQQEVSKINSEAVLTWAFSDLQNCASQSETSYTTEFIFVKPDGVRTRIDVIAQRPPRVIKVNPVYDILDEPLVGSDLERYANALEGVKLSPVEVCVRTLDEAKAVFSSTSLTQVVSLLLDTNRREEFGTSSVWVVSYYEASKNQHLAFYVSAEDGTILQRKLNDQELTPVPKP